MAAGRTAKMTLKLQSTCREWTFTLGLLYPWGGLQLGPQTSTLW